MLWFHGAKPLYFLFGGGETLQKDVSATYYVTVSVTPSVAFSAESSAIDKLVSATYNVSVSTNDVTSVQFELSAFAYNVTTSTNTSLLAFLSAEGITYDALNAKVSLIPVFVLEQTGQVSQTVSATYNVTASAQTASLAAYLSASTTYNVTCSASASVLSAEQFSVSATYNVTVSTDFVLSKTQGAVSVSPIVSYNVTVSMTPVLVINRGGGLVWKRKRHKRIPVLVGFPLRDE